MLSIISYFALTLQECDQNCIKIQLLEKIPKIMVFPESEFLFCRQVVIRSILVSNYTSNHTL